MKSGFDISISLDDQNDHKLLNDILKAKVEISDPNINLTYQGEISLGKAQKYIGDMHLENLNLENKEELLVEKS